MLDFWHRTVPVLTGKLYKYWLFNRHRLANFIFFSAEFKYPRQTCVVLLSFKCDIYGSVVEIQLSTTCHSLSLWSAVWLVFDKLGEV